MMPLHWKLKQSNSYSARQRHGVHQKSKDQAMKYLKKYVRVLLVTTMAIAFLWRCTTANRDGAEE
jgi:uncharacterized oligopeptide transporter (OPT) family protein